MDPPHRSVLSLYPFPVTYGKDHEPVTKTGRNLTSATWTIEDTVNEMMHEIAILDERIGGHDDYDVYLIGQKTGLMMALALVQRFYIRDMALRKFDDG